jgi:hypothetical protein
MNLKSLDEHLHIAETGPNLCTSWHDNEIVALADPLAEFNQYLGDLMLRAVEPGVLAVTSNMHTVQEDGRDLVRPRFKLDELGTYTAGEVLAYSRSQLVRATKEWIPLSQPISQERGAPESSHVLTHGFSLDRFIVSPQINTSMLTEVRYKTGDSSDVDLIASSIVTASDMTVLDHERVDEAVARTYYLNQGRLGNTLEDRAQLRSELVHAKLRTRRQAYPVILRGINIVQNAEPFAIRSYA